MSETETLIAVCPNCKKAYTVRAAHVGQTRKCRHCGENFTIEARRAPATPPLAAPIPATPPPTPASTPIAAAPPVIPPARPRQSLRAPATSVVPAPAPAAGPASTRTASPKSPASLADNPATALLCPICQSPVASPPGDDLTTCSQCRTPHHTDCWDYNHGCGLYGCKNAPDTEKLQDIEIPASFWGQTEKQCPNCHQLIQAAAVRCRHCGSSFEDARPQEAAEFSAKQNEKQAVATHQRVGLIFLIFALIPCTAPFAAIGGGIWYATARRHVAAMPPLQATLCRLALGISICVTVLITLIGIFYSSFATRSS